MPKKPKNFSRHYTAEELSFIEDNYDKTLEWLSKKLERPTEGLRVQLIKMGLGDFHQEAGTLSANRLAKTIGVSYTTVYRWIEEKDLWAEKRTRRKGVPEARMRYHITIEDFWNWAFQHQDLVNFTKIEKDSLPPEPEWVEPIRRVQLTKPPRTRPYTPDDDSRLWSCYMMGMKQKHIAVTLGRTLRSIEKRLHILRRDKFNESIQQKAK